MDIRLTKVTKILPRRKPYPSVVWETAAVAHMPSVAAKAGT